MNTDIRLKVTFPNHHKTKKLYRKLGPQGPLSLIYLWLYAAENKPDGVLSGMDEEDIAIAAQWDNATSIAQALLELKFLDCEGGVYCLHGWEENNAWAADAAARSDKARLAAKVRWEKRNAYKPDAPAMPDDASSMENDAPSNAPSPLPSPPPIPLPSPPLEKPLSAVASVALEIILADDTLFPLTQADIDDWVKLFPAVDVVDTLTRIQKKCLSFPAKRQSKDGVRGHIVGCLKMIQERTETFERIWKRYPNKDGKKEAEKHFRATVHTEDDLGDIHKALDNYLDMLAKKPTRPPKNGSTWFNNWKDWVNWEEPKNGRQGIAGSAAAAGRKTSGITQANAPTADWLGTGNT